MGAIRDAVSCLPPKSIAVVFGTRPEIIKLAPVVRLLGNRADLIHTGQHYDSLLSSEIALDLGVPQLDSEIGVGGKSRTAQIGLVVAGLDGRLAKSHAVLVQGDTNSALGGALAGNAQDVLVGHVEAGLRSFDRRMPEEHNRVLIDHIADMCWAPTDISKKNLLAEGIPSARIVVTGNTIVDALGLVRPSDVERHAVLAAKAVERGRFILATLHRPEKVDAHDRLLSLIDCLSRLPVPTLLAVHPRTQKRMSEIGVRDDVGSLRFMPPLPYREFLALLEECAVAVSDSGGIQEEASVLKVPVVVVRRSTERPEVLGTFSTLVETPDAISAEVGRVLDSSDTKQGHLQTLPTAYGDGRSGWRIVESLLQMISKDP